MKNAVKVAIFSVAFIAVAAGVVFGIYKYYQTDFYFADGTKEDTVIITGYSGSEKDIKIPKKIQGKIVEGIGNNAFSKMDIKSVELPDEIITIEKNAFAFCTELESVKLGKSVESIGDSAFSGCTKLKEITLPANVGSIGALVFNDCDSLEKVEVESGGKLVVENNVIYSADKTLAYCSFGKVDFNGFKFPKELKQFGNFFFYGHDELTSFEIPEGVRTISPDMFVLCTNLKNVTIPDSVAIIGNSAFLGCSSLEALYIPKSVRKIENFAFPVDYNKAKDDGEEKKEETKKEKTEEQKKEDAEKEKYLSKNFKLIVEKNSVAYNHAVKFGIKYEIRQ